MYDCTVLQCDNGDKGLLCGCSYQLVDIDAIYKSCIGSVTVCPLLGAIH